MQPGRQPLHLDRVVPPTDEVALGDARRWIAHTEHAVTEFANTPQPTRITRRATGPHGEQSVHAHGAPALAGLDGQGVGPAEPVGPGIQGAGAQAARPGCPDSWP